MISRILTAFLAFGLSCSCSSAQELLSLDDYEICGSGAMMVSSILSQRSDLERVGIFLDITPEKEKEYNEYIDTFIVQYPQLIADANGVTRKDVSRRMDSVLNLMMEDSQSALHSVSTLGPTGFLDVFNSHGRLLVQCAEKAGLK
jgi:hypothetical protein